MYRARDRAYVFDGFLYDVHLLERGVPLSEPGVVTNSSRLRQVFFDEVNTRVRERLLDELELRGVGSRDQRSRMPDVSDRERSEDHLFRTIERRFALYEVARRRLAAPVPKPVSFVRAPSASSAPVQRPWIALELVNQNGKPVPGRPYRIVTADKQTIDGQLDDQGTVRIDGIVPGTCEVACPYVEPRAATTHIVAPSDHSSRIALTYGFEDFDTVWSHPQNGDLRAKRDNPHVLVAGDEVFVPAIPAKMVYRPTDEKHTFKLLQSPLKLRLKLLEEADKPLAGAACELDGLALTSDADGLIEIPVDKLTDSSTLTVDGVSVALQIGALSPVDDDTAAGWKARLYNMGFLVDPAVEDQDEIAFAIEDFQAQCGIDVSGSLDDATTAKIKEVYGC